MDKINPALRDWIWINFGWDLEGREWAEDDIWF